MRKLIYRFIRWLWLDIVDEFTDHRDIREW